MKTGCIKLRMKMCIITAIGVGVVLYYSQVNAWLKRTNQSLILCIPAEGLQPPPPSKVEAL